MVIRIYRCRRLFTISVIKRSEINNQVQVRSILSQQGELNLLSKFADLLNGKTSYLESYEGYNMTVNLTKLNKVLIYFKKYPLKTKKYISYLNWLKVYKLVINKEHLKEESSLNKIKDIMKKINK